MRYLIFFGLALALTVALSPYGEAGVLCDDDGDGVGGCGGSGIDNCSIVPNGPGGTLPGSFCQQEDGDMDGYGNACDSDIDNDGAASLVDVSLVLEAAKVVSTALNTDLNCNGAVDLSDVSRVLAEAAIVLPPGPSSLACAGTIPCP